MKLYETTFDDYIKASNKITLHPKANMQLKINFSELSNYIIYGPPGTGKYTQALKIINNFSEYNLKYEKKMVITYNKTIYYYKISDIHFEIDMSLLGCNSKLLWHEIYNNIVDILYSKNIKNGIILCKNFHLIHSELLDNFYSYMQTLYNTNIQIKFFIITEHYSFIPENIVSTCKLISVPRPSKIQYNKCLSNKIEKKTNLQDIENIKELKNNSLIKTDKKSDYKIIGDKIIQHIINYKTLNIVTLRDDIYDLFIYDINIFTTFLYIIQVLVEKKYITKNMMTPIMIKIYDLFKYYNNNYRPIYHLEKYILYLITIVHEL
jgi:hypothetical protein